MIVGILSLIRSAEARLKRERICDAHLFPHHDTSCGFLRFLNLERTVRVIKYVEVFVNETREDFLFHAVVHSTRVAIHEDVLLARVTVEIAYEENIAVLLEFLHHVLHVVNCGMKLARRVNPTAI